MKTTDLNIYIETNAMIKQLEKYITNFPRELKYSYGFELRRLGVSLIRHICIANECVLEQKRRVIYLEQAYGEYEAFKFTFRLAVHLKAVSYKQATVIDKSLAQIGAMIIKWKKSAIQRSKEYRELYKQEEDVDFTNINEEIIQPTNETYIVETKRI